MPPSQGENIDRDIRSYIRSRISRRHFLPFKLIFISITIFHGYLTALRDLR